MTPDAPRTTGVLRVAAAQAESVSGDVTSNVATAVGLVEEAAHNGARLVVLPELFLTGYDPDGWKPDTCLTLDDPALEPLCDAARVQGVVVVVGAAVRRGLDKLDHPTDKLDHPTDKLDHPTDKLDHPTDKLDHPTDKLDQGETFTLSLLVFDRQGGVSAPYDKQHMFDAERTFFTPGTHGASITVDGWELGLGICYDGCFPEHAAAAATDGATAYLCPSAYYVGSEHRRDLYYAARALDNGIYVLFSGLAGRCGGYAFNGGSAVYDPEGRPVDRVGDQVRGIAYADLDPAEVRRVQQLNPIGRDRLAGLGERHRQELTG